MILKFFILLSLLSASLAILSFPKSSQNNFLIKFSDIQKGIKAVQKGVKDGVKNVEKVIKTSQKVASVISKVSAATATSTRQGDSGSYESFALCGVCQGVIDEFIFMRRVEHLNDTDLIDMSIEFCEIFELQSPRVCRGIIELNAPSILHIIDYREDLTSDNICRFLLDDGDCASQPDDEHLNFVVNIDDYVENCDSENLISHQIPTDGDDLIIVHITDIHVDFKYKKGSLAACKDFACCRYDAEDGDNVNATLLAGYWGDYRGCDTPWHAVEDSFEQIRKKHPKIDAIYFTGDIVDHFIFEASVPAMKESIIKIYELMEKSFRDIPVYPILGNHEAQNLFAPMHIEGDLSTQWLYDTVADVWKYFLPQDSQQTTLRDGGYYTTVVKPGLRLIAMNNNPCLVYNWWFFYGVEPIREQFQWLHDTLIEAEQKGEKVHILAHIPSNIDEFHGVCSREYRRIIDRFHKTIVAQFNGHTENYGFHLYFKENNLTNPISIGFNGGSIASYTYKNRNYAVYGVDRSNFVVKDVETWTYNLTAANLQCDDQNPNWYRQMSLREDFNLNDLSPSTMSDFVFRMTKDPVLYEKFWKVQIKNSDYMLQKGCDKNCIMNNICEIVSSDNTHHSVCDHLYQQLKE